ncbi:hypothetical protein PVAP13_3KG026300 [Panicum virgatum]|uniref:RING-type domain-containing protein n=1 Tax=Panicum virgatum TaxID=38727 RepID=A0A8T0ULI5_PANVG|nr:hypothetical protein PVAP13_3KG026300 [Panicum virgatum]
MADGSMEDGLISTSIANSAAAGGGAQQRLFQDPEHQDQFDEALRVLDQQGHHGLVHRVFLILEQRQLDEAMRVLTDDDDEEHEDGLADWVLHEFCRLLTGCVFGLWDCGYDEHVTFQVLHLLVLAAAREVAGFHDYEEAVGSEPDSGFGAVPAPVAAVARLEKRTFLAGGNGGGITECCICFGDFVDGEEVSVMPCPLRGHEFHPECITKWLGISSTCPLCRHGLAC